MAAVYTQGTVKANPSCSPENAAEELRKAMKGLGTNEAKIIDVVSSHSNAQRREIEVKFKAMYGKDLKAELKSELGGNFEDLVLALFEEPALYDAKCLKKAISGMGTKENVLIEILCSRSNAQIIEIKRLYKSILKGDLEKDIMSDTSGHFKRLLVSLSTANRDQSHEVDPTRAAADAKDFFDAGANKVGTDESTFNSILCVRSLPQLKAMFDEYRRQYGKEIETVIKSETSGDVEDGYLAIVQIARNPAVYFADRLYKSMKGMGTKDNDLIRVVVSRSEVDMQEIKAEFQQKFSKSLKSFIEGDASGDYKKLLLRIIGEA